MNKYQEVLPISKNQAKENLETDDIEKITTTLVSIAFYENDWEWVQNICLEYLQHPNENISGLAATCLGHIARIHGKMDKKKVIAKLNKRLNDFQIGGRVEDAINDIEMYIKD
ncbi:MAG: hypothetical protein J0H29_11325 [Sphingobacteriales bacterium]|nr:hypothetical protein [Sphingobacteriales bacterium]OJY90352.1 MAG: hypothetical protein BGP14_11825 [Sphingobacteriales bacterium 44-15]